MIVHKIEPQGYCGGVIHALKIAEDAIKDASLPKPIYMLGQIIHNSHVIESLKEKGIITIDEKGKTRIELLDYIHEGTVIFSAHGVSPKVYEKAKEKGLHIIDATCPYVLIVHKKMQEHLNKGYECIYIGTPLHPECEGVLGISDSIHFISKKEDVSSLKGNALYYATNQTTLSRYETESIFDSIKERFPDAVIDDKICNATTIRQEAMANQPKADLCIVVGDKKSSNTKKLAQVSQTMASVKTILTEDWNSLDKTALENISSVNISSGASTPSYIVDDIIEKLKEC